ncbi:MAG: hypothetical protein HZA50_04975 [Planctomycetes bacterium]|nr:hypothetical protein [Planctomycetota bacterium]
MFRTSVFATIAAVASILSVGFAYGDQAFVWIEGEAPATMPAGAASSGGSPKILSAGQWLMFTAQKEEAEKKVPADGLFVAYPFKAEKGGKQEVWARIGFEFARAPFDWRMDGGEWKTVKPDDLTSDLMEVGEWCEAAWLKLADMDLQAGDHKLEFRVSRWKNEKGEEQRVIFALDAICITPEKFYLNGPNKPGAQWQEEIDKKAEAAVYNFPEKPADGAARTAMKLNGLWQIARCDEQLPKEVAAPIQDFPEKPIWKGIEVPGDKNKLRPDLKFCHRLWYRAKVNIPETWKGRSFFLVFPCNSLNTTVSVNGQFCGFDKNPYARVQIDISKAVKPGVNEIWVGIRDNYYGYQADPKDPMKLRKNFNLPLSVMGRGWQKLVYPIWGQPQSGIIGAPELVAAGPAYAADVFCKPSVAKKELGLEITLNNPGSQAVSGDLICEAVNDKTGQVEMTAPAKQFSLEAGKEQVIDFAAKWDNPKLWWPDEPNLYRLRTTIKVADKPVDVKETLFGFREWSIDGANLRLNGVKWQGFSEMSTGAKTPEELIAIMKESKRNYGFVRMWPGHGGKSHWLGKEPDELLTIMDRAGVNIRRSGYLDGEVIGYLPDVFNELAPNWYDHLKAWIRGERNHPCVMLWSVENEMQFINARNLGKLDIWEPILAKAWEEVQKVDPTRPIMIDGGGATRANTLPLHGDHYTTKPFWNYPQLAYEANADQPPWTWDQKRPKFIGEELYAAGINPAYGYFGGECVFQGKEGNRPATGKAMQVISQGYRWFGITGCDFCQSPTDSDGSQYNGWSPRAVLVRQWDWTFGAGRKAKRTFGIFNNTRFADPLTFTWTLTVGGKPVATKSDAHNVAPGECEKFDLELAMPEAKERQEGELVLTLSAQGKEVFRDVKAVSVLPDPAMVKLTAGDLFVYDPAASIAPYLKSRGVEFTELNSLTAPPAAGKIWLIGRDALKPQESTTSAFSAYAAGGGRVILLEQANPLRFQGLNPAEAQAQNNLGRVAFLEDPSHPLLAGLADKDFFTWEPGEIVYRNAYLKPTAGAKSLLQCNESLTNCCLMAVPVGPGVMVLNQTDLTQKLSDSAAARTLMGNILAFAAGCKLATVPTAAAVEPALAKVLDGIGLQYAKVADPLEAMAKGKVAVVSATPANLKTLADNLAKVKAFTEDGGFIVLHGLMPEGLADYNKLVGFDHMIRPFRKERVLMAMPRSPLLSGASLPDVALYSDKKIFAWQSGYYVAEDTFSFVVDLEDVAPFGKWANGFHNNLVNGMVGADGWPYICNEPADKSVYVLTLPKPQTIVSWTWVGNTFYDTTSQVSLAVDNNDAGKQLFDVPEKSEAVTMDVKPPMTGAVFTIRHEKHSDLPDKKQNGNTLLGCDNLNLFAQRPADFRQNVKPLLNIGAMVHYPRGKGGIILCNLLFKDAEAVPVNASHKRTVLTAILSNLKSPFAGKTVIVGANLEYATIDISKQANQYRTDQGWFGDRKFTFKDMPVGDQTFAGVKFNVYEFATSPVPTVIMLAGKGVPNNPAEQVTGIPVNKKADALFFLHTARIDQPLSDKERKDNVKLEIAKYVVHYADGQTAEIPLTLEADIGSFRQKAPAPLSGAQIGWTAKFEGTEDSAVAYVKQWNNPRPDAEIKSIDLVYGKDKRAVPALIAVTAAQVVK